MKRAFETYQHTNHEYLTCAWYRRAAELVIHNLIWVEEWDVCLWVQTPPPQTRNRVLERYQLYITLRCVFLGTNMHMHETIDSLIWAEESMRLLWLTPHEFKPQLKFGREYITSRHVLSPGSMPPTLWLKISLSRMKYENLIYLKFETKYLALKISIWHLTAVCAGSNICRVYAHVHETIDGQPSKEHVVCSGLKRETTVYTSKTNVATVQLQSQGPDTGENGQPQFLIRYEGKLIQIYIGWLQECLKCVHRRNVHLVALQLSVAVCNFCQIYYFLSLYL